MRIAYRVTHFYALFFMALTRLQPAGTISGSHTGAAEHSSILACSAESLGI